MPNTYKIPVMSASSVLPSHVFPDHAGTSHPKGSFCPVIPEHGGTSKTGYTGMNHAVAGKNPEHRGGDRNNQFLRTL